MHGLTYEDVLLLTFALAAISVAGICFGTILYIFQKDDDVENK